MDRRKRELERQIHDNGITYNIYADQTGPQRPWSVDLFPLILGEHDWRQIEAGVLQRARLLENIVADTYGEQRLLHEALIPPALIQGHPGYLRAMHGASSIAKHLHIVAFDLAREPDGHWSVVSQRTEAPSGLGYLLENRMLISRQFPAAYDAMQVRPLNEVYRELIDTLKRLSPAGAASQITLLTPGPYNETYFEHAYLARQLGLTLAEGSDLTVRDQRLYLRTLRGLEPVHVLLKRLDDAFLDPLELRADSTLGVPGLLQAVRAGNVVMANAPGTGFLESPALLGFMPALAERLLGEPLRLPALNTWWCGERAAMAEAIPQLPHCVIKPTFPHSQLHDSFEAVLAKGLTQSQSDEWLGRIMRTPETFTLQSYLPLSQMPTWHSKPQGASGILPRSFKLRVFALSNGADSWYVLPGGMARIATHGGEIASMQRGGSSADVWVQAPSREAVDTRSLLQQAPVNTAHQRLVTSRAAENLFWLGRYTERAENTLRLARLSLDVLGSEDQSNPSLLSWLSRLAQQHGLVQREVPTAQQSLRVFERALVAGLWDTAQTTSVGYNLRALLRAASSVRERLSTEHWQMLQDTEAEFFHTLHASESARPGRVPPTPLAQQGLQATSQRLAAITGFQTDRMSRDDGWRLLSIGRHIERLDFLAGALTAAIEARVLQEQPGFDAVLKLFDSTISFHAQYQQSRTPEALSALLVTSPDNPRSLAWVAQTLRARLRRMQELADGGTLGLAALLPETPASDSHPAPALGLQALLPLLAHHQRSARQVAEGLSSLFFTHSGGAAHSVSV